MRARQREMRDKPRGPPVDYAVSREIPHFAKNHVPPIYGKSDFDQSHTTPTPKGLEETADGRREVYSNKLTYNKAAPMQTYQ